MVPEKFSLRGSWDRLIARRLPAGLWLVTLARQEAGKAILQLQSLESQRGLPSARRFAAESGFRMEAERMALFGLAAGGGFQLEGPENRWYRGALQFLAQASGELTVVNVVPVESYVAGVLASEMHADFPFQALKAQAVAARSALLARLGKRHVDDGFDVCAEVHCQAYGGIKRESENARRAVAATAGLVLSRDSRVVDAVYHAVCGGHTEDNDQMWEGAGQPHLRGVFDGEGSSDALAGVLMQEDRLARWIAGEPPVYCNVAAGSPEAMHYARKYFRWVISTSAEALQSQIAKITGEDFGALVDLIPMQRGRSGRIRRLRVVGTVKTFEISSELTIRRALAPGTLWSSCFVVSREGGGSKPPGFVFRGAGRGHGVGMCQVGAGAMAWRGAGFMAILQHYYRGVVLEKAY